MRAARTAQKAVAGMVGDEESELTCGRFGSAEVDIAVAFARMEVGSLRAGGYRFITERTASRAMVLDD